VGVDSIVSDAAGVWNMRGIEMMHFQGVWGELGG
jgi:hypothetical protein